LALDANYGEEVILSGDTPD